MPSIIADNVAQVVMGYLSGGEPCENVYHVYSSTGWSPTTLAVLLSVFRDWETTEASPIRSSGAELIRQTATDLTSLLSARQDEVLLASIPGVNVSPVLPSNVTLAIKANIGERGRGRNGRSFWIGLAENQVVSNAVVSGTSDDIVDAMNQLGALIVADDADHSLGIIHTWADGAPLEPAIFSAIVGWVVTDRSIDSQRDRLPFHKAHRGGVPPM